MERLNNLLKVTQEVGRILGVKFTQEIGRIPGTQPGQESTLIYYTCTDYNPLSSPSFILQYLQAIDIFLNMTYFTKQCFY